MPGDAATGHAYVTNTTLEPTCTATGTKVTTCSNADCDYRVEETIPANGHSWTNADCDKCDATRPTITFKVNGKVVETMYGESVKMPTPDGIDGFTFYGWTTASEMNDTSTAPTVSNAGATVSITADTTYNAVYRYSAGSAWQQTAIGNIKNTDVVVITVTSSGTVYAMSNDKGTSAPTAVKITVVNGKISGTVADNIKWNITNSNGTLTIYPNGKTTTWLYCTNSNTGLKVGTGSDKTFVVESKYNYLYNNGQKRYIGVYNNSDWRSYTTTPDNNNIKNQTLVFYVLTETYTYTLSACGHTEKTTTTNPATCVDTGSTVVTCADCGKVISTTTIPATGEHIYENGVCTGCGRDEDVCEHTNKTVTEDTATCTTAGTKTLKCDNCGEEFTEVSQAKGHSFDGNKCTACNYVKAATTKTTTYTMSSYSAGTQYAANEAHKLDDKGTVTTTQCHFTSELRIYSSSTHDGYAVIHSTDKIKSIKLNAGNKADTLYVYVSNDGKTWTKLSTEISVTSTSYKDYSLDLGGEYNYVKLDVKGTNQVRVKSITLTTVVYE